MVIKQVNWYGFDLEKMKQNFGDIEFVNTFCVFGEHDPVTVYRYRAPDRSKGEKEFLLAQAAERRGREVMLVRRFEAADLMEFRCQDAVYCKRCHEVAFSVMRNHAKNCQCGYVFIDGGQEDFRCGGPGFPEHAEVVMVDLIDAKIIEEYSKETH